MAEVNRESPADLYDYFQGLSIEEIKGHLSGLVESFEDIKKHYTGPFGKYRRKIKDDDMRQLTDTFGDLLPMSTNPAVQQEITTGSAEIHDELVHTRIALLMRDVGCFMSKFENSGVTMVSTAPSNLFY